MAKARAIRKMLLEDVIPKKRLGRHVEHDPRSRDYPYGIVLSPAHLKTVHHRRWGHVLDQGNIGSCTGNAVAQAINTIPIHRAKSTIFGENEALDIYKTATELDGFPGTFPPDDTGSSGLAAAKAACQKKYISAYKHAFTMEEALSALQLGPVITGVNWYEGFDNPGNRGIVSIIGNVRGGHEFLVRGFEWFKSDLDSFVVATNSWGGDWGIHGNFRFTVRTWQQLLDEQGDVTILIP